MHVVMKCISYLLEDELDSLQMYLLIHVVDVLRLCFTMY